MSTFVGAFDVTSKLTGNTFQCLFSHMWNGIATRHADTIDTKFFAVNKEFRVDSIRVTGSNTVPHVRKEALKCIAGQLGSHIKGADKRAHRTGVGQNWK